ncbi:MAG: hypothetical protein ACTHY5_11350 [Oceanisphaera sp.]|uniref:hypothetical protein n=1 Tax=Oceanisphaera sp. TaxID=1929979 RepID=UPI003F9C1363
MSASEVDDQNELVPVRRRLRLDDLNQLQIELLAKQFNNEAGVSKVVVRKQWLEIEYDAAVLTLERVIELLEAYGGELSQDWWTSFKANWYLKREEKLRAQLNEEP